MSQTPFCFSPPGLRPNVVADRQQTAAGICHSSRSSPITLTVQHVRSSLGSQDAGYETNNVQFIKQSIEESAAVRQLLPATSVPGLWKHREQ